jgi:NAD(P)-dependent dehydrogenase (short-subunit alcohol dehydrogenase family)
MWIIYTAIIIVAVLVTLKIGMRIVYHKRAQNLRPLEGTVAVITGGSAGIGQATIEALLRKGVRVIACSRDSAKVKEVGIPSFIAGLQAEMAGDYQGKRADPELISKWIGQIQQGSWDADGNFISERFTFRKIDLSDLKDVEHFATYLNTLNIRIDMLINNAGGIFKQYRTTKQGFEWTMGVNHFSHYYLTDLLLPLMNNHGRILNLSSYASKIAAAAKLKDPMDMESFLHMKKSDYNLMTAYSYSKLANVFFAKGLNTLLQTKNIPVKAVSIHPGTVDTDFISRAESVGKIVKNALLPIIWAVFKTMEEGAQCTLQCAFENYDDLQGGAYYSDCKVEKKNPVVTDANTDEFMAKSLELCQRIGHVQIKNIK